MNAGFVPPDHWYHDPRLGGGRLVGEGCHFIDLLQFFAGARPVRVQAAAMIDAGVYHGDNVCVTITFADGSVGVVVYLACNDGSLPKERVEVSRGGASIVIDDYRELTVARGGRATRERVATPDKGHRAQVAAVIEALRHGRPAPVPVEELVASSLATLAAARSVQWRQPIDVDIAGLIPSPHG